MYLVISSKNPEFKPEILSPRFMLWSEAGGKTKRESSEKSDARFHIWLIDLRPVWGYWQNLAEGSSVSVFLRQRLLRLEGSDVVALLDTSPWRALLGLEVMFERNLTGLIDATELMGSHVANEISWSGWFRLAKELGDKWCEVGKSRFNVQLFRKQLKQMAQAVQKLGMRQPTQAKCFSALSIRRRYGQALHDLWVWTLDSSREPSSSDFPWISWTHAKSVCVQRHLDAPLIEWDHIQSVLQEDFSRLCVMLVKHGVGRVLSLEWRVVFLDLSILAIPIRFRHPHDLPAESPHHRTALLQACYSFQDAMPQVMGMALDSGVYEKTLGSWELCVTEAMAATPVARNLFGDTVHAPGAYEGATNIMALENKLHIPLKRYQVKTNWIPERSFDVVEPSNADRSGDSFSDERVFSASTASVQILGKNRPLFIYKQPRPVEVSARQRMMSLFCERIMGRWWVSGCDARRNFQRDYYVTPDDGCRHVWLFKDTSGNWYEHGLYN